jgi:hypothetical protein
MKDGSQRREPETSVFVLIARRMEPEHPAVRLKGHSAQAPEWPFAISRPVSARRKRAVIEIARGPLTGHVLHGLLNLLLHELLDSLRCLKATAVAFVEGHR